MSESIDLKHELEDFDEEEERMDPLVMSGFVVGLFSVIGIPLVLLLRLILR